MNSSLSVIIPCLNEEEGIPNLTMRLKAMELLFQSHDRGLEFILVDDGSTDSTEEKLRHLATELKCAKVLVHRPNRGLGEAFRSGLAECTHPYVAALDSDCTYRPDDLLPMLELAEQGYDLVQGSPYAEGGIVEGVPRWAIFLSRSCSLLYKFLMGSNIKTFTSMFRVFNRDRVRQAHWEAPGFLAVAEILLDMIMTGGAVIEYPCVLRAREYGTSKRRVVLLIRQHIVQMARIVLHRSGIWRRKSWDR